MFRAGFGDFDAASVPAPAPFPVRMLRLRLQNQTKSSVGKSCKITFSSRDYQPSKDELEEEMDMQTLRKAFFELVKIKREPPRQVHSD